ncbi:MAG: DUF3604 domain-containing protein [Planctomycetota bacterium]
MNTRVGLAAVLLLGIWLMASRQAEIESHVEISPETAIAGEVGTWTVGIRVGDGGIETGGALRVQMPDAWHSGPRNSATPLQASDPKRAQYVTAKTSRDGVVLKTTVEDERAGLLVKHSKESLDGRFERYVMVVRVEVVSGSLRADDVVEVIYGDVESGSPGFTAGDVVLSRTPVMVAIDRSGEGTFESVEHDATVAIAPGPVSEIQLHAPSQAVSEKDFELLISLLDRHANVAREAAAIELEVVTGEAELPKAVSVPEGAGHLRFRVTPTATGVLRIRASFKALGLEATSNPVDVSHREPERRLYWGDLHSHTHYSWDGVGTDAFGYARDTSGLDFYAMTDHSRVVSGRGPQGLHEGVWGEYTAETEAHHEPGRFVTLHAYECSFGRPFGHHNVFFRGAPGALKNPETSKLPELWEALDAGDALTIPHHTGKFPGGIDFSIHDPERRRNFEIYSGHGLSEVYDPEHPLAFEQSDFTSPSKSLRDSTFAHDVWRQGLKLSTIAASDDHRSKPGQPHYGLTGVWAEELTREGIFQALYDRRTYGTTGSKIVLEVTLNGTPMGGVAKIGEQALVSVRVLGTDVIERVEVLRWRPDEERFSVAHTFEPMRMALVATWRDEQPVPGAIYFVRVSQVNEVRGLPVMAWSSPIWTE